MTARLPERLLGRLADMPTSPEPSAPRTAAARGPPSLRLVIEVRNGPQSSVLRCACPDDRHPYLSWMMTSHLRPLRSCPMPAGQGWLRRPARHELASLGISPWLDKWEIRPGDSLVQKLFDEGVATADAVIVVVSQYSAGKRWVRAELDAAMVRKINEDTRLILRLDEPPCPPRLKCCSGTTLHAPKRIREAARLMADTIHGRDTRPAVAHRRRTPERRASPA